MSEHSVKRTAQRPRLLALTAITVAAVSLLAGCEKQAHVDPELSATLIQPVAKVELKTQTVKPGSRTGEQIYQNVCSACHGSGALGAPKAGDTAAWGPRIAQGFDTLVKSATAGKNNMPPRGGASDLTDDEVKRAVAYLANKAGANFTEPPVQQ